MAEPQQPTHAILIERMRQHIEDFRKSGKGSNESHESYVKFGEVWEILVDTTEVKDIPEVAAQVRTMSEEIDDHMGEMLSRIVEDLEQKGQDTDSTLITT